MTIDELIQELQGLRKAFGGEVEVFQYNLNTRGAADLSSAPIIYKGYLHGKLNGNVSSILLGHPENDELIRAWEGWHGDLNLERFITAYNEEEQDAE